MINSKSKKYMLIIFILFLVLLNIFQFSKIRSYKTITITSDNEFGIQLELICHGIETIEEAKVKDSVDEKILGTAILSSATGQATSVYIQTSYYEENKLLYTALWNLNNTISNNTRINNLLETHDFSTLIPIIRSLKENPLDKDVTEKLYLYFRDIQF